MIKGMQITLHEKTRTGVDELNAAVYAERLVTVDNVLIEPMSTDDIITSTQLYGKKAVYRLCIPKGDSHNWDNVTVEFFGKQWRTFGEPLEYIEELLPGDWNKKVMVERYG